jgi:hypothetical protein
MLIFLGIVILIIAGYFLAKAGFFSWVLAKLTEFVFPLMKELLLKSVGWIA